MATSFIKSFIEAVNPAAARATKRSQDPQDPGVRRMREPQAATNALLDATSAEALEERPASPDEDLGLCDRLKHTIPTMTMKPVYFPHCKHSKDHNITNTCSFIDPVPRSFRGADEQNF